MKKRVSIKSIAESLGVSTATVSLVLSGKAAEGRVGKEISEKIRETAKSMNYLPNGLARSLRIGRSQTIGLIVADISNPFFGTLSLYIQEEAEKFGYTVIIANTNESSTKMGEMIDILKSRQVDGYIIVPTEDGDSYITQLVESNKPLVLVDRYFPNIQTNNVIIDNYRASYDATRSLLNNGCKHICLFMYKSKLQHMIERKKGYHDALAEVNRFDEEFLFEINYANIAEDIASSVKKIVSMKKTIDGIFFTTNSISIIGIKELLNHGIEIQKQIQIVCFDKSDAFDFMNITIPYVRQPVAKMGRTSVDLLIDQITNHGDNEADLIMCKLSAKLIEYQDN
ncbi:LacI family transcriptional regulator [Parabacteroides sp. PF5-5]|uniref:LacI family DNA-binding transcriptional regulator n=1 Tax=unclassified Parabacteroides TaxID=2649774 RepID=UPI0024771209|nr:MULTISPECIES: LacI family DNA-binding transcriptional regulator [unclassified Parabacteroides]MDH6306553.1 LacI family transcriptional regulator [Parabacteroides sp. PH5-39]MDH6317520.1 LacI family transcriptional regulator [Parabacteroides sp. PF5-13]MDH6321264.1 LacI family transcriptional regulator [Parabacteroides sp. PH5-13]MDH6324996.1 LacI family transcriptional regulator [Parabacteroides sp. PH5-8]MDH6328705.1 LacI family transcriptional regulator [Parabacteroides sp. PH5-41]